MTYDLLVSGGTLVDPAQGINARKDVAFTDGTVAAVEDVIPSALACEVVDATDRVVVPGMIDLHVHVFWGVSHYGIEPDPHCIAKGVTTAVDAGTAGADTFPGFRKYVIEVSDTRLYAQLNISSQGMISKEVGELDDIKWANVNRAVEVLSQNRDLLLGVKVRLSKNTIVSGDAGIRPLHLAREAADAVGLPIMVHPQDAWCDSLDEILAVMGDRDILTHCFHGNPRCGILNDKGRVRRSVHAAMERGVVFDVGHGEGSFSWDVADRALAEGVLPQTISSDLHIYNVDGPVFDLATTVSKFLHLGLSLDEAVAKVTATPAEVIGMEGKIGTLKVGAWGDLVVFDLQEGKFDFSDVRGEVRQGGQKVVPLTIVKGGSVYKTSP